MKLQLTIYSFLFCAQIVLAQAPPYIEAFQTLAIQEMERTGIPASITLAQGIIESAWGKGVLARSSNNHFGIKCKQDWAGKSYQLEDDDFDSEGNLIKSCFRAYEDAASSYIDHSDFLKKGKRYAFLFDIDSKDYVSWARGLQSAGYATDPEYANKLINKIEQYALYRYDYNQEVAIEEVEEKTGITAEETEVSTSTVAVLEVMEAPSYVLPAETSTNSTEKINQDLSQKDPINKTPIPTLLSDDLNTKPKVEKVNIKKRRMTLHGSFGEL